LSGSSNGNLRIWNTKTYKCMQCISNPNDIEYSTLIVNQNMILAGNSESRRIRLWSQNNIKDPLRQIHLFEGDLINIQKLVGLGDTHIGILCYAYYYENDFKIFLQEIRVYDIRT
jgi:WD40 repeat protein